MLVVVVVLVMMIIMMMMMMMVMMTPTQANLGNRTDYQSSTTRFQKDMFIYNNFRTLYSCYITIK